MKLSSVWVALSLVWPLLGCLKPGAGQVVAAKQCEDELRSRLPTCFKALRAGLAGQGSGGPLEARNDRGSLR